jgi:hypothetical protein
VLVDAWNGWGGYALLVALSGEEAIDLVEDVAAL